MKVSLFAALALAMAACNDVTSFSNHGDHYEGQVARLNAPEPYPVGLGEDVSLYLSFDGSRYQDSPGEISTNDGTFHDSALRAIPQQWHDALSLMSFGESRTKSMIYAVTPARPGQSDALAVVSLMKDGTIELRLLRSAPGRAEPIPGDRPIFAVFRLGRAPGPAP